MSSNLEVKECCLEEWIHPELSLKVGADVIPVRTRLEDILD